MYAIDNPCYFQDAYDSPCYPPISRVTTPHPVIKTTSAFKINSILLGTVTVILGPLMLHFLGCGKLVLPVQSPYI